MTRRRADTVDAMVVGSTLGEYLRARRELIRPGEVGLPEGERRRVPGLRREEVALLAGISAEYCLRLEQGRDQHPSDQVLDSIANALRLDSEAAAYLHAWQNPCRRNGVGRHGPRRSARVCGH
jgi:transcriptional regulator with XRE-family HTH domain